MFSGRASKTVRSNPFHVLWVFQPSMPPPPLETCLLRTKSVYWDNPTSFPVFFFSILSAFALRIDVGWGLERNGIEKGDDWGVDWKEVEEGKIRSSQGVQFIAWYIPQFRVLANKCSVSGTLIWMAMLVTMSDTNWLCFFQHRNVSIPLCIVLFYS